MTPSLVQIRDAIARRETSAEAQARAAIDRAQRLNPDLNAFLQVFDSEAMARARAVDAAIAAGQPPGPLAGVPIALKDNICLSYGRTTCASRFLENYQSPFTATAAQRLIDAGAVIIGKTNLDEFAMGSSTEHSAFGPTRNPWELSRVPGGTSGGSAAAIAARICPAALGSDTGGSIRQPAAFCGVVGVKPTYGRVSRFGLVAHASSLDQIGPLAATVADAAALLSAICGHDPLDSTSARLPAEDFTRDLDTPIPAFRLGIPRQANSPANSPAVAAAFEAAAETFRLLGGELVEIDLPNVDHGIAAYYLISTAEASSNLARFDGIRYGRRAALNPGEGLDDLYRRSRAEGFGAEVQRRIMLGTHVLSAGYFDAYYLTALKVRRLIKQDYDRAFGLVPVGARPGPACDAVLMPTAPTPAFRLGEKTADPLAMYLEDVYTVGVNLAGLPAVAFPAGFEVAVQRGVDGGGGHPGPGEISLPVGVQLIGPPLAEARLLRLARMFEMATSWHQRRPLLASV